MFANDSRPNKSILLVEDDLELCLLMKDYFSQQGFRIDAVHDGGAAWRGRWTAIST